MGERAFFLDPVENSWRGFLFDRDCMADQTILANFDGIATKMKKDLETVEEAWLKSRTVITSNAQDFLRDSVSFQRRENNNECRDCWGLFVIPNRGHDRVHALKKSQIARGIMIDGYRVPWKAVAWANLCVSLERNGTMKVSKFERCTFCEQAHPLKNASWYKALPLAQGAVRPKSRYR